MYYLEVVDGQGRCRQISLNRTRLVIGREPTCDIHLPHPGVSRRHAQLQQTDQGRWLLQDLDSRNKVFFKGKPVPQIFLDVRQPFRIADYWLTLVDQEAGKSVSDTHIEAPRGDAESSNYAESVWLEQLQSFQRRVPILEEPRAILEELAKEFRNKIQPQVLGIGIKNRGNYVWEIIQSDKERVVLQKELDEADKRVKEEPSSVASWVPSAGPDAVPTCMLFPLKGLRDILGHVYVANPGMGPMSRTLRRYLSLAAGFAGLAWENLQLEQMQKNQIEIEKELQHARQIQIDLFPPTFEVDSRLDAYAVNLPSARVSGDYYDLIRTGPDTVAFVIADAMGHGMPAALLMAAVRAALRFGLTLQLPWKAIFQGLDDLIRQARNDTFVTGLVGEINLQTRDLKIVSAGHPPASILVDGVPRPLPSTCLTRPWGLDLETPWEEGRISLQGKQWSIMVYTDGITDTVSRINKAGAQRVFQFHQQHCRSTAEDLCQGLLSEVAVLPGVTTLGDDQTVLVLCSY